MTIDQIIKLVEAIALFITAVLTILNKRAIQEVHLTMNSRLDQLLSASKAESRAEGVEEGRNENKTL